MSIIEPRNAAELNSLVDRAPALLCAVIRGSLANKVMPPRAILEWYTEFSVEMLIAAESAAQQIGPDTPEDAVHHYERALQNSVVEVSELFLFCEQNKMLVLQERILDRLRARALFLPPDFDTSYEGMLPRV